MIIFDVNIKEGNLKIIKKTRSVSIQSDAPSTNVTQQGPVYGPVQGPT